MTGEAWARQQWMDKAKERIVNAPVPFPGTKEERDENRQSHSFQPDIYGEDPRCTFCDCKPWHTAADYRCGVEVPRADMPLDEYMKGVPR